MSLCPLQEYPMPSDFAHSVEARGLCTMSIVQAGSPPPRSLLSHFLRKNDKMEAEASADQDGGDDAD